MENEKSKPGPVKGAKASTLVEGTIVGIKCGWDNQVIPPDQIYELAVLGLTNKEMANFYGVSDATIARNFAAELQKGREMTKIKLRRAMMKNACDNMSAAVQIFLAKAVLGMSETGSSENTTLPWVESDQVENTDENEESL
jgi:DNA-binding CsgD family transcriptional regulator